MKIQIPTTKEVDIKYVHVILPVLYGQEDIPNDFPLRYRDTWEAIIDIDSRKIENWPQGKTGDLYMKVTDSGQYILLDENRNVFARINDYVPHGLISGEYGDYVDFKINEDGVITNMTQTPSFEEFFENNN